MERAALSQVIDTETGIRMPGRPQPGSYSDPQTRLGKIHSNHFEVVISKGKVVNIFQLSFSPELPADATVMMRTIFQANRKKIQEDLGSDKGMVLSGSLLFSLYEFKDRSQEAKIYTGHKEISLMVKLVKKAEMDMLLKAGSLQETMIAKQMINLATKNILNASSYKELVRSKYYRVIDNKPKYREVRDARLRVLEGFKASSQIYYRQPKGSIPGQRICKLLVDFNTRVLQEDTLLVAMKNGEFEFGSLAICWYGRNRTYRILGIEKDMTPLSKFPSPGFDNFVDYYQRRYGVTIMHTNQPMVYAIQKSKDKGEEKIHLVPELLRPTGMTDRQRNNFRSMQDLAQITKMSPNERKAYIEDCLSRISKPLKEEYGFSINPTSELVSVEIAPPPLKFGEGFVSVDRSLQFDRVKKRLYESSTIPNLLVFVNKSLEREFSTDVWPGILKTAASLGIQFSTEQRFIVPQESFKQVLVDFLAKTSKEWSTILFFVSGKKNKEYAELKRFCCKEGHITQFLTKDTTTINRNSRVSPDKQAMKIQSVLTNTLIQLATKSAFSPWRVAPPRNLGKGVMLIGIDMYHKPTRDKESVFCVCSTLNDTFTKYYTQTGLQKKRGEDFIGYEMIGSCIFKAILVFQEFNEALPSSIVIYRDGVAMNQVDQLRKVEIVSIQKVLDKVSANFKTKIDLMFIIVQKKVDDRFFWMGKGEVLNPQGGTVITDECTKEFMDFFLCSQEVRQGTCNPTQYSVIQNETQFSQAVIHELTFFQTFNYFNWRGPIKIPAGSFIFNS